MNNKSVEPLCVTVLSDTHYYSKKVGTVGKAYDKANSKSQKFLKDSAEVLKAAFSQLEADNDSNIILISGDTTNNGEIDSHKEFIEMLYSLKNHGKRIYVITATHDYNESGYSDKYVGDKTEKTRCASRDELWDMYYDFGPSEAIAIHRESMSYIIQLADGYRLFALNDDSDNNGRSGFSDECFEWIKKQINLAQEENQVIIPMTHHPLLSPSDFFSLIGKNDMHGNHEKRVAQFADMGVSFMLTGHSHIHDISYQFSEKGNVFYDISTSSLVGYPALYRKITFDAENETMHIVSEEIHQTDSLYFDGKSFNEHLENQFFGMIKNVITAAAESIERLAYIVTAFSVKPIVIYKYGWLIKPFAKMLNKLKIGTVASWVKKESGLKKSDYKDISDKKVVDYIISLLMNLFGGDAPYSPDSAYYKITLGLMNVLDSFLNTLGIKISKIFKGVGSLNSLISPLVYNSGISDRNADLPFYPSEEEIKSFLNEKPSSVKESRKGPMMLTFLIIAAVILLPLIPLIFVILLFGYIINRIRFKNKIKDCNN